MNKRHLMLLFISASLLLSCSSSSSIDEYENKVGWFVKQNETFIDDGLEKYFNMPLNVENANAECLSSIDLNKKYKVSFWTTMSDPLKGIITSKLQDGKYIPAQVWKLDNTFC